MEDEWERLASSVLCPQTRLLGPHPAFDDGVDEFEVAWVEGQAEVDALVPTGGEVRGETHVVLHVAAGDVALGVRRAVELAENLVRALAENVGQHVEPAAVGHADDDFRHSELSAHVEQRVHHGDEALAAVDAEALGALVFGVDEGLEGLGHGELLEDVALLGFRERGPVLRMLHPGDEPAPPVAVEQRHELDADVAAVGAPQPVQQLPETYPSLAGEDAAPVHHLVQLGRGEGLVGDHRQVCRVLERRPGTAQRVKLGEQVAAQPEGVQRLVDAGLEGHARSRDRGGFDRQRADGGAIRRQRVAVTAFAAVLPAGPRSARAGEQFTEAGIDAVGVLKPAGVKAVEKVDVRSGEEAVLSRHKVSCL